MTNTVSIQHLTDGTFAVHIMFVGGAVTGRLSRQELEDALAMAPGKIYTQSSALPEGYPTHANGTRVQYLYDSSMVGAVAATDGAGLYGVRWDDEPGRVAFGYTYSMLTQIEEAPHG